MSHVGSGSGSGSYSGNGSGGESGSLGGRERDRERVSVGRSGGECVWGMRTSMKEFRSMLSAGAELRLRSDTEALLKTHLLRAKKLFAEVERVLEECGERIGNGSGSGGGKGAQSNSSTDGTASSTNTNALSLQVNSQSGQTLSQCSRTGKVPGSSSLLHSQSMSPAKKNSTSSSSSNGNSAMSTLLDDEEEEDEEDEKTRGSAAVGGVGSKGRQSKQYLHILSALLRALDRLPPGLFSAKDLPYPAETQTPSSLPLSSSLYPPSLSSLSPVPVPIRTPASVLRDLYNVSVCLKERVEAVLDRAVVAKALKPK